MNVLQIVKDNKAEFSHYRAGNAYYEVAVNGIIYSFPVAILDLQQATILRTHKAVELMRYIRKALDDNTFVKVREQ